MGLSKFGLDLAAQLADPTLSESVGQGPVEGWLVEIGRSWSDIWVVAS